MTPAQRLEKALELSALAKELFLAGLRHRHPDADETTIRRLMLEHLARCHNENY